MKTPLVPFLLVLAVLWPSYEAQRPSLSRRLQKPSQEIKPSDVEKAGFLPGIEIQGEERQEIIRGSAPENCQTECLNRRTNCHAWTFLDQKCFLKYGPQLCDNTPSKSRSSLLRSRITSRSKNFKKSNPEAISGLTCSCGNAPTGGDRNASGDPTQHGCGTVVVGSTNGPTTYWNICWEFRNGRWFPVYC